MHGQVAAGHAMEEHEQEHELVLVAQAVRVATLTRKHATHSNVHVSDTISRKHNLTKLLHGYSALSNKKRLSD